MEKIHLRIGSAPDNDIVVPGNSIEAKHAEFFCDSEGNAFITDLNSTYGTFINGQELRGFKMLKKGDKVVFGKDYIFRWETYSSKVSVVYETEEEVEEEEEDEIEEPIHEPVSIHEKPTNATKKEQKPRPQTPTLPNPKINRQLVIIYGLVIILSVLMYSLF